MVFEILKVLLTFSLPYVSYSTEAFFLLRSGSKRRAPLETLDCLKGIVTSILAAHVGVVKLYFSIVWSWRISLK